MLSAEAFSLNDETGVFKPARRLANRVCLYGKIHVYNPVPSPLSQIRPVHQAWSSLPRSVLSTANPTSLLFLACVHLPLALVEFTLRLEAVVTVMQAQPGCEALCALERLL